MLVPRFVSLEGNTPNKKFTIRFPILGLLSQWLTFKLSGITYLVREIKFKGLFHGPKWLSKLGGA